MNRRSARYLAAILLTAIAISTTQVWANGQATPINMLIIVTDDQRWDELGVVQREQGDLARFPFLQTPNLDALAAAGTRFRNAFVTTSLCSPSRAAILTGQYNHTNGILDNRTPFAPRQSWATKLTDAGYTTALIGKWHHGRQWERPGFTYTATFAGQGNYNDTGFKINGKWTKTKGYIDSRSVDYAIDFMRESQDKPFAMMIGFKAVHQPFTPMEEHAEDYLESKIIRAQNYDAVAPWNDQGNRKRARVPKSQVSWRNDILRTVNGVDKNVGRLLAALDELELAENTLVIFTSDNGYYLGEHRLGDKRSAYEESMRVPMIVRLPGVIEPGKLADEMVLNIDIAPTLLEFANQHVPSEMQGKSWLPLLRENRPLHQLSSSTTQHWREEFLYEYWQEYVKKGKSRITLTPSILAVRTEKHKLVTYPDHPQWLELFDLQADPYEMENLAGNANAAQIVAQMCTRLHRLVETTSPPGPRPLTQWLTNQSLFDYLTNSGGTDIRLPYRFRVPSPNC